MTANSQLTVKQAARLMNVSERSVYDARKLMRSGREDLIERVEAGNLGLHRALILAGLKPKPEPKPRGLWAAWGAASVAERETFLRELIEATKEATQ